MTRGNRILSTFVLLGLLTLSLSDAARSQSTPAKTVTISGSVGVVGVTLRGFPGTPVMTDENGFYSVEVPQGWSGTITPVKLGYTFEPPSLIFTTVAESLENQDYTATLLMYRISGYVGVPGARIEGLPEETVAGADGVYTATVPYGWSGGLTPSKDGHGFEPAQREYRHVTIDYVKQDYKPRVLTFTISGNVGLPGVVLQGLPEVVLQGLPRKVVSDPQGKYQAQVDYGWSGTVTPMKEGYRFEPHSREYRQVVRNFEEENYTAKIIEFTISGDAGLPAVRIEGFPVDVVTDVNGGYQVQVGYGWSGKVSPRRPGYEFEPTDRQYNARIREDVPQQNYTPRVITYTISGSTGVPGVMMKGLPRGPVSDEKGHYQAWVEYGWAGTVTPSKEGFTFTPPERTYTSMMSDARNENYAAAERMVTISNVVAAGNEPIQDVRVTAKPGEYTALTDSHGRYRIRVPYGWSGRLVLSKEGWDIRGETEYSSVTRDIIDGKSVPAGEEWPAYQSGGSPGGVTVPGGNVLVIPTGDASPERIAETTEDLRVMLQILREKLSEPRMIRGVLRDYGSLLGEDRRAQAIYLEGSAALFVIGADFPPSSPAQQPGEGEPQSRPQGEAADPVWQRARQKLYSPGSRTPSSSGQTQTMTFEQFQEELLRSLKHAANIRHIDPNELVVLTLVAQNEDTSRAAEADLMRQYENIYGSDYKAMMGMGHPAPSATVLTMQAKKADIDAFAQGTLDFDQFRQKVRSFTY